MNKYAIKSIERESFAENNGKRLVEEINILVCMDSSYTIKFFGAYYDEKYVHLVMKNVNGGDMS